MHMRATLRSSRTGSAMHNDKTYLNKDIRNQTKQKGYRYRMYCARRKADGTYPKSFAEAELQYYVDHYMEGLNAKNQRQLDHRHPERCRDIGQLYHGEHTCPEEQVLRIVGKNRKAEIDAETFWNCVQEYISAMNEWNSSHGNHMHFLDVAVHAARYEGIHAHIRRVWDYTDQFGYLSVGQSKALECAGVELPEDTPEDKDGKPCPDRYRNRKRVFDAMSTEIWEGICRKHGFEINSDPSGRSDADVLKEEIVLLSKQKAQLLKDIAKLQKKREELQDEVLDWESSITML